MADNVIVRAAGLKDVFMLAPKMRKEDREEVWAAGHQRPAQALINAIQGSTISRAAFVNGQPMLMFGVGVIHGFNVLPDCGVPWALTSDLVEKYPVTFWRVTSRAMTEFRKRYPVMVQVIDKRHAKALEWAKRLGFTSHEPIPFGPEGLPFVPITLGGEDVRPDGGGNRNAAAGRDAEGQSREGGG